MVASMGGKVCGLLALTTKGNLVGLGSLIYPTFRAPLRSSAICSSGRLAVVPSRSRASPVRSGQRELSIASVAEEQHGREDTGQKKLVLYSKQGCCLCDGLKEKLQQVAALGIDGPLYGVRLEVRDITTNPEWEQAYQYEIPVLARIKDNDIEEVLPRLSPRMGVEQISKKLSAAFGQ